MEADVEKMQVERNNILYDLGILAEWQQDPEAVVRPIREKERVPLAGRLTSSVKRAAWTFLRGVGVPVGTGSPCSLQPALVKLIGVHMNWHFDVTRDGTQLAILQEHTLEIRMARDEFSGHFSKWTVPRDTHPQWRMVAWNPSGDLVACSDSRGSVMVYDIMGTKVCSLPSDHIPHANLPNDLSFAVCGLIFTEYKDKLDRSSGLLVLNYQGNLKKYTISAEGSVKLEHQFSFGSHYSHGITTVVYSPENSLLFVGGEAEPVSQRDTDTVTAMQLGITSWRILSDIPHYKLVTNYEEDLRMAQRRSKLLRKIKHLYSWRSEEQDGIYKLCLSPSAQILSAIHQSGALTLLDVPSLRIRHSWPQEEQPGYDEVNQSIAENPKKRKAYKEQLTAFYLTDANWWSDQEIILARGTGAVCVSCANTLRNLLGASPEWFEAAPLLSMASNKGFLGIECECKYSHPKRHLVEKAEEYEDSDEDLEVTLITRTTRYVRQALYFVTDSERFQPPRKRPKLVTKTYRLVCLKSTTPEELYNRKIEHEEYGEALALAKAYGLDCDLVYQRQWRKTPVSVASIQDYLSKISKRSWVLHECLERVPENIDAMRELLQYGLRGTDLEALISIGNNDDGGRFILCDRHDVYEESIDPFDMQAIEDAKTKEKQYIQDLLTQVSFNSLSLEQKELCRARTKLVQYLDRLATYEEILGGAHYAPDRYDSKFFEAFRSKNIVEVATEYSRDCDWRALEIILTYHGDLTLPHRLAILANFPETFPPREYQILLPEINVSSDSVVDWQVEQWTEPDWCYLTECREAINPSPPDLGDFLYEADGEVLKDFSGFQLTHDQVRKWYKLRACQIESLSKQVDHSLDLIKVAQEKHVQGLEELYDDLLTMDMLVYDCLVDDCLNFQHVLEMPNIDRLKLIMSRSSFEMYSKHIKQWLVPFLQRCEKRETGSFNHLMEEYLVSMAKTDLTLCLHVFEACRADQPKPVISDEYLVMEMALKCVYVCQSNDQLSHAYNILECLPQRGFGVVTEQSTKLHNQVDELECHLSAAEILEKNELPQTIAFIRDTQHNEKEAKTLFIKLTRMASRRLPKWTEKEWLALLVDILALRQKVYHCVDSSICYQIFVESLLCSSDVQNIALAGKMVELTAAESKEPDYSLPESEEEDIICKVAYPQAVELVLQAAREYFDSSTNLTDSSMELAKACLNIIKDSPAAIKEELNLIDALALLDGFGVNILPLQVRICEDRLSLVQQAINTKSYTYKNTQRLLKLGRFLRVCGDTDAERDGHVLQLIAQAALKVKDVGVAYQTCARLMEMGHSEVWTECKQLAEMVDFHDIRAKTELLSFAVTHCSADMIEPILRAKCLLETQILYERVHGHISDRHSQSPLENPLTAKGAIQQTKEILSTTNKATRKVLSSVSNKAWWKKTLKSLQPLSQAQYIDESDSLNKDFTQQGCHPFYEDVIQNSYPNKCEVDYEARKSARPDLCGLHFGESLLYTSKLEETLSEGERYHPSTEVLLQLAQDCLALDSTLGLAYILALPEPLEAEKCFEKNPGTAISLQLATYYYAVQMFARLDTSAPPHTKPLYLYPPSELVQKMLSHTYYKQEKAAINDWSPELRNIVEKLKYYNELVTDYNQAQVLDGLDRGIDVGRFTVDPEYKKETILGLAMTTEHNVYQISVSLANRYKIPSWDIYMANLEYLFDSGLPTAEIEGRMNDLGIMGTLQADRGGFHKRMQMYVYPSIAGDDHDRLALYYSLLEGCDDQALVSPSTHVKLLKKIKTVAPGLDYVKLTNGEHDPLDILRPILTSDNINALAKVASKLPDRHGGFLQPSVVYCGWAIQNFCHHSTKTISEKTDWIHRYEMCSDSVQKLLPEDFIKFIDAICFAPDALKELQIDIRQQIVKRALKYSRQQLSASRKKNQEQGSQATWDNVVKYMQESLEHLDKLQHDTIIGLRNSEDSLLQNYAREFDLSRSQINKLERLYLRMVLDGQTPVDINELLSVINIGTWNTATAYKEAIGIITQAIKNGSSSDILLEGQDLLEVLRTVVSQVGHHQQEGGFVVSSEDMMSLLRPFCADSTVAVDKRLEILSILEQSFSLEDKDLALLILYRTEAVVFEAWPNKKITEKCISSDDGRASLFHELLRESESLQQFQCLSNLLRVWPVLEATENSSSVPDHHPWCELVVRMIEYCQSESRQEVVKIVKDLQDSTPLSVQCLSAIHDVLIDHKMALVAVKCLLLSQNAELHEKAIDIIKEQKEDTAEDDAELLKLILLRLLVSRVVDTAFYPKLIEYILSNQTGDDSTPYYLCVETIANQLHDAGYETEAGSLMTSHRGMHPALRTFDAALGLINRWLNR